LPQFWSMLFCSAKYDLGSTLGDFFAKASGHPACLWITLTQTANVLGMYASSWEPNVNHFEPRKILCLLATSFKLGTAMLAS
jgi:hypothetical protein